MHAKAVHRKWTAHLPGCSFPFLSVRGDDRGKSCVKAGAAGTKTHGNWITRKQLQLSPARLRACDLIHIRNTACGQTPASKDMGASDPFHDPCSRQGAPPYLILGLSSADASGFAALISISRVMACQHHLSRQASLCKCPCSRWSTRSRTDPGEPCRRADYCAARPVVCRCRRVAYTLLPVWPAVPRQATIHDGDPTARPGRGLGLSL